MKIFSDGFTIGHNPSPLGGGFAIATEEGVVEHQTFHRPMTNNEAELLGVLRATELAEYGDTISTDSMNTYWWVMKRRVKARPDLKPFAIKAFENIEKKNLELIQENREYNLAGIYLEEIGL